MVGAFCFAVIKNDACQSGYKDQIHKTRKEFMPYEMESREKDKENNGDANGAVSNLCDPLIFFFPGIEYPSGKEHACQTLGFEKGKPHGSSPLKGCMNS
jgi:hypothetical protein